MQITEQFGLEGTFKSHLIQSPCIEEAQLDVVDQSPMLEWAWLGMFPKMEHPLPLWETLPVFHHLHCKKVFLISNLNQLCFSLKPSPLVPWQQALLKSVSIFLRAPTLSPVTQPSGPSGAFSSPGWTAPSLSASPHRISAPSLPFWWYEAKYKGRAFDVWMYSSS